MIIFALMKQVFLKITSLLLAFVIMVATVSWTVEKHYCLGQLVDLAFFQEAESCGIIEKTGQDGSSFKVEEPSCCSNEVISIKGMEDLSHSQRDIKVILPLYFFTPLNYHNNFLQPYRVFPTHVNYNPLPLIVRDIQLLKQVFLI